MLSSKALQTLRSNGSSNIGTPTTISSLLTTDSGLASTSSPWLERDIILAAIEERDRDRDVTERIATLLSCLKCSVGN